jgi:hypothetical protein
MPYEPDQDHLPVPATCPILGIPEPVVEAAKSVHQGGPCVVSVPIANRGAGGPDLQVLLESKAKWVKPPSGPLAVPPGRTLSVDVTLVPPVTMEPGPFGVRLLVRAPNAEFNQEAVVRVQGVLTPNVRLVATPARLALGRLRISREPISKPVVLTRDDGVSARPVVTGCEPQGELALAVDAAVTEAGSVEVNVHTANLEPRPPGRGRWPWGASRERGAYSADLVIADRDGNVREVRVPISLSVADVARLRCSSEHSVSVPDLQGEFPLSIGNEGGEPLHVRAKSKSRWLTPRDRAVTIPPGGRREVRLAYELTSVQELRPETWLELRSNDNGQEKSLRRVRIQLERLWPELTVEVDPPNIEVRPGRTVRIAVHLTNRGQGVAHVSVADQPEWLSLRSTRARVEPGQTETLAGRIVGRGRRPGPLPDELTFDYNGAPQDGPASRQLVRIRAPLSVKLMARRRRRSGCCAISLILLLLIGGGGAAYMFGPTELLELLPWNASEEAPAPPEPPSSVPVADLIAQALAEKNQQRPDRAIWTLETHVLPRDPDNEDAHWVLAWSYIDVGDEQRARDHLGRVLQITSDPVRRSEAANALRRLGG